MPAVKLTMPDGSPPVDHWIQEPNGLASTRRSDLLWRGSRNSRTAAAASAAWFMVLRGCFAAADLLAALLGRVPSTRDIPPSTRLAYGAVGIMAAILVYDVIGSGTAVSSGERPPEHRPEWIESPRPHAAFALESPVLEGLHASYHVRRHRTGGGLKDDLTFGSADDRGLYVHVSIYRPGLEGMVDPDPFEAVVGVALESEIDAELQEASGRLHTKFGTLPVMSMTVAGAGGLRSCIAAADSWNDPQFGLVAWWCNDGPEIVAYGEFACLLDRLTLMTAGGDDRLAEFFARAELKRRFCNAHGTFVSATPRLVNDWMHAKRTPRLRGRIGR